MKPIRVIIADDHPLVRSAISALVSAQSDMAVVAETGDAASTLKKVRELEPDVLILDISLPDMNGLTLAEMLAQENLATRIVFLSTYNKETFIYRALEAGAYGYISKTAPTEEIIVAVRWANRGEVFLSPQTSQNMVAEYLAGRRTRLASTNYDLLTPREQEVFKLVVEGHTNRDIAATLHISPKTVDKHRSSVMRKLEVDNLADLVRYAVSIGILEPDFNRAMLQPGEEE